MKPLEHDIPVNCPKCGQPLVFIITKDETNWYSCTRHGTIVLPPNGRANVVKDLGVH